MGGIANNPNNPNIPFTATAPQTAIATPQTLQQWGAQNYGMTNLNQMTPNNFNQLLTNTQAFNPYGRLNQTAAAMAQAQKAPYFNQALNGKMNFMDLANAANQGLMPSGSMPLIPAPVQTPPAFLGGNNAYNIMGFQKPEPAPYTPPTAALENIGVHPLNSSPLLRQGLSGLGRKV